MSKFNTPFVPPRPIPDEGFFWDGSGATQSLVDKFSNFYPTIIVLDNLFLMNKDGQFVHYESMLPSKTSGGNLVSGRVFVTDLDGYLRQLQLEITENNGFEISASRPVKTVEPKAPSFWTRVRAFFGHKASKAKIQAYNDAVAFNAAFDALTTKEEFRQFNINLNPPEAEYQEEALEPDAPKAEAKDTRKEVELKNSMSENNFNIQLNLDSNYSYKEFYDVLDKPNVTAQEILEAHIKLLKSDIARRMLVIRNNGELNMAHAQHTYLALTSDLSPSKYFSDAIENYVSAKQTGDQVKITHARNHFFNAQNGEHLERIIEQCRPSNFFYKFDEYYDSVTKQMKDRSVIDKANKRMRKRVEALEEQEKKAQKQEQELKQFDNDLREAAKFTSEGVQAVVTGENPDCDVYLEALAHMMIGQVANMMLADKKLNLEKAKPIYEALTDSIYEYVNVNYRQQAYNILDTLDDEGKEAAIAQSNELISKVTKTGLGEVFTQLNEAEPENKTFEALNKQLQNPAAEIAPSNFTV